MTLLDICFEWTLTISAGNNYFSITFINIEFFAPFYEAGITIKRPHMENFWQYTHAKYKTSPCSNSLPKREWWLLGNTLISTGSTSPTDRRSLSHVEESKNDSAPIERKFHSTVKSPTKASMLTAVYISPFLSFWSSCVKRRVQGAVDDWLRFGSVRVCRIGTLQFLK